jgi:EAL domain-containing protein (putative c-di-GMP-specific phosphodiesterase class I)
MFRPADLLDAPPILAEPGPPSEWLRQLSVRRYRLTDAADAVLAQRLQPLTALAAALLDCEFAAVHILDGTRQVTLAASCPALQHVAPRASSLCHHLLSRHAGSAAFLTPDARTDPLLRDAGWTRGRDRDTRFYAAAPLIGGEGIALGTLSVWSTTPAPAGTGVSKAHRLRLEELARQVVAVLDAHRDAAPTPGRRPAAARIADPRRSCDAGPVAAEPTTGPRTGPTTGWSIQAVLDEQAVRTLFQPIVHLESGTVVGFEALTRGPAGSALESPMALLQAAAAAGLVGELDWLCRVSAMRTAADSGLPPSLSWFVNVEPAGLDTACPQHLLPDLARASTDLRVVLEIAERDIHHHVGALLHVTDQARRNTWGVALDDVGVEAGSLALLPLLRPDVVKLDMSLMDALNRDTAASVVAAVSAYAEHRGAVVLAEGIETEQQQRLAKIFGAQYGQGYRFGRPGPLPATVPAPRQVIPLRQHVEPVEDTTPFQVLREHIKPRHATQAEIAHIGAYLQHQAASTVEPGVVLAHFQHTAFLTDTARAHLRRITDSNALTILLADDLPDTSEANYRTTRLPAGSPMAREWVVIVLRPHYAAAFAAHDRGNPVPDPDRTLDYLVTHNRDLVVAAARTFIRAMAPQPDTAWLTRDAPPAPTPDTGPRPDTRPGPVGDHPVAPPATRGPHRPSRLARLLHPPRPDTTARRDP